MKWKYRFDSLLLQNKLSVSAPSGIRFKRLSLLIGLKMMETEQLLAKTRRRVSSDSNNFTIAIYTLYGAKHGR